jgi:hypothetical protein
MEFSYRHFELFIHLLVAFIFLADILKAALPDIVFKFLTDNRNTLFGIYYMYLAYNIYRTFDIKTPTSQTTFE